MLQAFTTQDAVKGSKDFEKLNNAIVAASRLGAAWAKLADDWKLNVFDRRAELSILAAVWGSKLNEYWEKYTLLWIADKGPAGAARPFSVAPSTLSKDRADVFMKQVADIELQNEVKAGKMAAAEAAAKTAATAAAKKASRFNTFLTIGLASVGGWWLYRSQKGLPFLPR